jgi:hypothetical protein
VDVVVDVACQHGASQWGKPQAATPIVRSPPARLEHPADASNVPGGAAELGGVCQCFSGAQDAAGDDQNAEPALTAARMNGEPAP